MKIGYVRAARIVDQLEEKGVVGPAQGSNPRDVLVGLDELDRLLRPSSAAASS
jgi:S-DNA-T family DNA segregation ATPase FtsK/SpoIIIE